MQVLIDGDIVLFRAAASAENEEEHIALSRIDNTINQILEQLNATEYQVFVGHPNNFRKQLDPNYKSNRLNKPRPRHLSSCKSYIVDKWNARGSDGLEADDLLGINQTKETIIASIDKDLLQITGYHWNWVRRSEYFITPLEGIKQFYRQMLIGDRSDNITGVEGIGEKKAGYRIDHLTTEEEMFNVVREMYNNDARMLLNGKLLHILQQEGEVWTHPELPEELLIGQKNSLLEKEVQSTSTKEKVEMETNP